MTLYNVKTEDPYSRQIRPVLTNTKADGSGDWYFAVANAEGTQSFKFGDSPSIDAFGRIRVSSPVNEFNSEFQYNLHPLYFDAVTASNGTITHNANHSSADLNVTTDSGSKALLQTFEYFRYQPGKSLSIAMTFIMPSQQAGTKMQVGYSDDDNGFFFEVKDASTVQMVRRTKTSGSVVDNVVAQSDWNGDKLDGTGVSGVTIDWTLGQQLRIDLQWLSIGRIRMCFDIDGILILAHEFLISNVLSVPSTTTANLPIRWLIENTAAVSGAKTMEGICVSVYNEGGDEVELGHPFGFGNGVTTRTVSTTPLPVVSIRPATTLNSITNRVKVRVESISILNDKDIFWQVIYLPTSITNNDWQSPVTHSSVETDIAGTAITGGIIVHSDYASGGKGQISGGGRVPFTSKLPFELDYAGTDQTRSLSVVCARVGAQDSSVSVSLNWTEVR